MGPKMNQLQNYKAPSYSINQKRGLNGCENMLEKAPCCRQVKWRCPQRCSVPLFADILGWLRPLPWCQILISFFVFLLLLILFGPKHPSPSHLRTGHYHHDVSILLLYFLKDPIKKRFINDDKFCPIFSKNLFSSLRPRSKLGRKIFMTWKSIFLISSSTSPFVFK